MGNSQFIDETSTVKFEQERHGFRIGTAQSRGRREYMEDTMSVHSNNQLVCLGLFDGHAGDSTSNNASQHLWSMIESNLSKDSTPSVDECVHALVQSIKEFDDRNSIDP